MLGLPGGYDEFYKGKPITTMSYDHWVGKRGNAHDGTRFTLQEILLSQLTNFLYDDGRGGGAEPTWWGREKKRSISTWSRHIEILAMVEETMDGEFFAVPPTGNGHVQPNGGPVGIGLFNYALSEQSARVRERADAGDPQDRRAPRRRALPEARRDPGRLRVAPARRRADGRRDRASASSTTPARCSAPRACSAWTRR